MTLSNTCIKYFDCCWVKRAEIHEVGINTSKKYQFVVQYWHTKPILGVYKVLNYGNTPENLANVLYKCAN